MPIEETGYAGHVYFILPIYNEEVALPALLEMLASVQLANEVRTIIAVDDGSTDSSAAILSSLSAIYPIKVITHSPNRGIPGTFKSALEYVVPLLRDEDVVIIMESDRTSDPALIPALVEKVHAGSDIVIASRHAPGGAYVRFPWYRTVASTIVNIALRVALHLPKVEDYTIFYRAYRGSILKRGFAGGVSFKARKSFAVNGEILLILSTLHPSIEEIPLHYDYGLKTSPSSMPLVATLIEYVRLAVIYMKK
jgi:dolichol-phosphate mannosyltransferase